MIDDFNCAPIPGFEGLYEVDTFGNVYSVKKTRSRRGRKLKGYDMNGYRKVNLYDAGGNVHKKYIHRLVAETFIPNPYHKGVVNHIDCDRANNHVENLEWVTQLENIQYCAKIGNLQKR